MYIFFKYHELIYTEIENNNFFFPFFFILKKFFIITYLGKKFVIYIITITY